MESPDLAFRVRRAQTDGPFVTVELMGGTAESIERAIAGTLSLAPGSFFLKKVSSEMPVAYGNSIGGFHAGLTGPHEAFLVQGELDLRATRARKRSCLRLLPVEKCLRLRGNHVCSDHHFPL
jgi:hypothetical protein